MTNYVEERKHFLIFLVFPNEKKDLFPIFSFGRGSTRTRDLRLMRLVFYQRADTVGRHCTLENFNQPSEFYSRKIFKFTAVKIKVTKNAIKIRFILVKLVKFSHLPRICTYQNLLL
jgi:hypothetical protein